MIQARTHTDNDNNKVKRKLEFKMPSFCAVLRYSNCVDREKDRSYYCLPSIVKNNGEEDIKLSKLRREKLRES